MQTQLEESATNNLACAHCNLTAISRRIWSDLAAGCQRLAAPRSLYKWLTFFNGQKFWSLRFDFVTEPLSRDRKKHVLEIISQVQGFDHLCISLSKKGWRGHIYVVDLC